MSAFGVSKRLHVCLIFDSDAFLSVSLRDLLSF